MPAFSTTRNVELSAIYYIETSIDNAWTGVEVVKSFLSAYDKTLPVVCIRLLDTLTDRLEIGSTTLDNEYSFIIDIFATSDGQRIDLSDFIMDKLKDGWIYYTHAHTPNDNSTLVRTNAGRCIVVAFTDNSRIDFGDEVANPDRFRHKIVFRVRKS